MSESIDRVLRAFREEAVSDNLVAVRDRKVATLLAGLGDQLKTLEGRLKSVNQQLAKLNDRLNTRAKLGVGDPEETQALEREQMATQVAAEKLAHMIERLDEATAQLNSAYDQARGGLNNKTKADELEAVKIDARRQKLNILLDMIEIDLNEIGDIHLKIDDNQLQPRAAKTYIGMEKNWREMLKPVIDKDLESSIDKANSLLSDIAPAKTTFEGYFEFGKSKAERAEMNEVLDQYIAEGKRHNYPRLALDAAAIKKDLTEALRIVATNPGGANEKMRTPLNRFPRVKYDYKNLLLEKMKKPLEKALEDPTGATTQMKEALGDDKFESYMVDVYANAKLYGAPEISKLSIGEAVAIYGYTADEYRKINGAKLGTHQAASLKEAQAIQTMTDQVVNALDKLKPVPGTSRRGEKRWPKDEERYVTGQNFDLKVFWSTGVGFSFPGEWQITITGKTGKDVAAMSKHPKESEILFPPGTRFRVTRVNKQNPSKMLVEVEEV